MLVAESLATASGNDSWQGGVAYRRGHLWVVLREPDAAIAAYENAVDWCGFAGDSLCMAESLEQLSAMHAFKDSFQIARQYFRRALLLLERYGAPKNLQTANADFGILLMQEGEPEEAFPFLLKAKALADSLGLKTPLGKAMNNLSTINRFMDEHDKAIEGYLEAIRFNETNGVKENIV